GDTHIVGASPEILARLEGDKVTVRPIAGTRKRGATPEEDRALAEDLLSDEKERAEHIMLVDLGRNDLGRVAATGTVEVTDRMVV
ncbi:chorismate-binding protein, partial [Acinetobacter baumannii]